MTNDAKQIKADLNLAARSTTIADRDVYSVLRFNMSHANDTRRLDPSDVNAGQGRISVKAEHLCVDFDQSHDGAAISQQLRFGLPEKPVANGMGMRLRLRGWQHISYIAIGHTEEGAYHHAKATHPLQDEWFDLDIGFKDLAWGWRNAWKSPDDRPLADVRFYIKGVPGPNAGCDLQEVRVWREAPQPDAVFGEQRPTPTDVLHLLYDYQQAYFPDHARMARSFLATGQCPLAGGVLLDWPVEHPLPPQLGENGTYQYSWHSQHPAVMLLLLSKNEEATETERSGALAAARDLITDWLARSYDQPDPNMKYAWYDHGVAERQLALIMLHAAGQKQGYDARFMTRLRRAIHRHGQLLASDIFYAGHQPIRYHNHAWFQDLALMTTGLAFPGWSCSDHWIEIGLTRIQDQFARLIIRDGNYAVFAENSIGYHFGISRLVSNIGSFAALSGRKTDIPEISAALDRFSSLMRYPGGRRAAGQGDTFRLANKPEGDPEGREPLGGHQVAVLPRSGYAIAKGDHTGLPFMLCFFATSASSTHKHADNLSFTLYLDGIEWLIDPSFHSHEYAAPVPGYLRGATAHNALVLPNAEYRITAGLAQLSGERNDVGGFQFEGTHEAVEGHLFRRSITGGAHSLDLEISDAVDGPQAAEARLMFHCGEGISVTSEADGLRLRHPGSALSICIDLPPNFSARMFHGQATEPVRGVTGTGFLQSGAITTVEIQPGCAGEPLLWRLRADNAE